MKRLAVALVASAMVLVPSAAFAKSSAWTAPVPTGCVPISAGSNQCKTNVGHYDVIEAEASLIKNMKAAGWTQRYSDVCRSNDGFVKGSVKVCYRVAALDTGSYWTGFFG